MSNIHAPPGVGAPATAATAAVPAGNRLQPANMSIDELKQALTSDKLTREEKTQALEELLKRLEKSGEVKAGEEKNRIKELMEKLKNGTITEAELRELGQALGVDPNTLMQWALGGASAPRGNKGQGDPNIV